MNAIDCQDISLKRGKVSIFRNISLSVKDGEFVALIGHNGAGKSSLIKMLLGLIPTYSGNASVLGRNPGTSSNEIGYLPENVSFYENLSVQEKVSLCSKGQRQRLGLAQALLTDPKLLFLDEPTVGLDPLASDLMYRELVKLKQSGSTVIVCTHELLLVEDFIDRTIILCKGHKVADGTVKTLAEQFSIPYELVSSSAVEIAQKDEILFPYLKENKLFCPANELEKTLAYLEKQYGVGGVGVVAPSLLEIYKRAVGTGGTQ